MELETLQDLYIHELKDLYSAEKQPVRTYAELLGDKGGAKLLQTTLQEQEETDKELTKVAKSGINVAVAK